MAWEGYRRALRDDPDGVAAVLRAPAPSDELAWVIENESAWNPAARNSIGATGLLQWLPGAPSRSVRTSPDDLAFMSLSEQAEYVARWYRAHPPRVPGDVYVATFTPAFLGKDDDAVIYDVGSAGWTQNPSLRPADGGPITVGSVRARGIPPGPRPTAPAAPPAVSRRQGGAWLAAGLLAGAAALGGVFAR